MVTRRQAVGAHYGLKDWLLQRLTAVVMAVYTLLLLAIVLWHGGLDYGVWQALFANAAFELATFLFMVALQAVIDPPRDIRRWIVVLVSALASTVVTYIVFDDFLSVLLPRGSWTGW